MHPQFTIAYTASRCMPRTSTITYPWDTKPNNEVGCNSVVSQLQILLKSHCSPSAAAQPALDYKLLSTIAEAATTTKCGQSDPTGTTTVQCTHDHRNREQQHTVRKESSAFSWTPCAVLPCTFQITPFINPVAATASVHMLFPKCYPFSCGFEASGTTKPIYYIVPRLQRPNGVGAILSPTSSGLHMFARSIKSQIKTTTNHTTTCNGLSANSTNSYPDETRRCCNDQFEQAATQPHQTGARN